jgi:hypothetical protein
LGFLLPTVSTAGLLLTLCPVPARAAEIQAGDLSLTVEAGRDVRLTWRGVPVIRESGLYVVTPGWTKVLLNPDKMELKPVVTRLAGGQACDLAFQTPEASAKVRYEVRDDNTFVQRVTYTANGVPAQVEYTAACLNANLIAGRPYTATTVTGPRSGKVPLYTESSDQTATRLCPFVKSVRFDTTLGSMDISVEGNDESTSSLNIFDARGITIDWAHKSPVFWVGLGSPTRPVSPAGNTVTVTWKFGPKPSPAPVRPAAGKAKVVPAPKVAAEQPLLLPKPKQVTFAEGRVTLDRRSALLIAANAGEEEKAAAREVQAFLSQRFGLGLPVKVSGNGRPVAGSILIAVERPPKDRRQEGYRLDAVASGRYVAVRGDDRRGAYNGVQTLKQLLRKDAKGVYVPRVTIRDWPTLSFRGVHWFGGPESVPVHRAMIERILGPLKMNAMVYEADFTQWESQPGIWEKRSTPKADVRKTVEIARKHFIEPIPLLQTLGHGNWLFVNGQNRDIAARPDNAYHYNPEKPRTYEVLFPIFQEALDLFKPKYFHIGHDEVTTWNAFPSRDTKKTVTELFNADVQRLHAWLKERGVRTMIWGDELLHASETPSSGNAFTPEDAAARRAALPKDVIVTDWHYRGDAEYPSIATFQKGGHEVIGSTWSHPANIINFSRGLAKEKSLGLLQTTWAGWTMSAATLFGKDFEQFAAYVLAAEAAWNGGANDPVDLGWAPEDVFRRLWNGPSATKQTFTVDLGGISNARMWEWVAGATTGKVPLAGAAPVWLRGALDPAPGRPESVTLPVGRKTARLAFRWGTTHAVLDDTTVATLTVRYADGGTQSVPIRYGRQILCFTDRDVSLETFSPWVGRAPWGQAVSVREWTWANPRPGIAVESVSLTSSGTEAAPVLLGVTGV